MSRKTISGFQSLETATAFVDGMLYVNDSAIEEVRISPIGSEFIVIFEDTDYDEDVDLVYQPNNMGA